MGARTVGSRAAWAATAFAAGAATTAGAASVIDGGDVRDGSLQLKDLSSKARKALKGKRGRQGPQGVPGAIGGTGAPGANGVDGTDGAAGTPGAAGPILLRLREEGVLGTTTYHSLFLEPDPTLAPDGASTTQSQVDEPAPPPGFTARRLGVRVNGSSGGDTVVALFVNGTASNLSCTVPDGQMTCEDVDAVDVPTGALFSLGITPDTKFGGAGTAFVRLEPKG